MKKQVKTQIGKDDNILWVSKAGNCIAFKSVPGYQPMTMETSNELWAFWDCTTEPEDMNQKHKE